MSLLVQNKINYNKKSSSDTLRFKQQLVLVLIVFFLCIVSSVKGEGRMRDPFLIVFEPVEAKYVRLTVFGVNAGNGAAIDEIEIFTTGSVKNLALASKGSTVKASSCLQADGKHRVDYLNDGKYGNDHCWIAESSGMEWVQVKLRQSNLINTVAFSRDRTGVFSDRIATSFRVETSLDGNSWTEVAFFPGPGGGRRGRIVPDRQSNWESDVDLENRINKKGDLVRHEFVDASPQHEFSGESICLNGNDWWMTQINAKPHWDDWEQDTSCFMQFTKTLPGKGQTSDSSWLRVTVPGSVQTGLLENGIAPNPWYFGQNYKALEKATVGKQTWFFKRFAIPSDWKGKRIRLWMGAVDYRANYYLNGKYIGQSEGHFAPVSLELDKELNVGQDNVFAVQLDAFPYESPIGAVEGRKFAAQLPRSQILANWRGTDFAPTTCPLGISDDVFIIAGDKVFVDDIWVRPKLNDDFTKADLNLQIAVDSQEELDAIMHVSIYLEGKDDKVTEQEFPFHLSTEKDEIRESVEILNPELWWPNGYGKQSLYKAIIEVKDKQGKLLLTKSERFGIRKVEMDFNEGHEMSPYPWTFVVNGKKIYAKGAGWVPITPMHAMEKWRYERILFQAKAANFTMIRWWGGGVMERPAFYDLCDSFGIMVFQDYFLANNEHDNPRFLKFLDSQATAFTKQLRNHPSIVLWSGGNELFNSTVNYQAHVKLWKIAAENDPDRPFTPSSPAIGVKHAISDYFYRPKTDYAGVNRFGADPELHMKIRSGKFPDWQIIGQPHNDYYNNWIEKLKNADFDSDNPEHWSNAFDIQFTAEGGASAIANYETLCEIIPGDELESFSNESLSPAWLYHNARPGYYDWLQHNTTKEIFGPVNELADYVTVAQFSRAQIVSYGLEEMRRRKFRFSGTLMWQLNETWPNAAGNAIVDFFGRPRITYDFIKRAYEPVHISLRFDSIQWTRGQIFESELWVSNDRLDTLPRQEISWKIHDYKGHLVAEKKQTVDISANASQKIGEVKWVIPNDYDSYFLVYCQIRDVSTGDVYSKNSYVFSGYTSGPHMFSPVVKAAKTELLLELVSQDKNRAVYSVKNIGEYDALICQINMEHSQRSSVIYSDNSFCLPAGDEHIVELEYWDFEKTLSQPDWRSAKCKAINSEVVGVNIH